MTSKIIVNNIEADVGVSTITFGSNIQGNLIGNVTGNITGNVTGNVAGNITGNVVGNITGNVNSSGVSTITTLQTGAIQTVAGKPILNSTGNIIQVVQGILNTSFTCVSNGTATAITGLTATITPTSSSSKILVLVSLSHSVTQAGTTYGGFVRRNGSTNIQIPSAAGSRQLCNVPLTWAGDANQHNTFAWSVVDSPATTSSTSYGVYVINDNGGTLFVNRSGTDQDNTTGKRTISTITCFEITA
jgi:hypothetical protein